jgi:hypothetical protein
MLWWDSKGITCFYQIAGISRVTLEWNGLIFRQHPQFIGLSFDTVASAGINAAAIEYVPETNSCAFITAESMFTLHAGANYRYLLV